VGKEEVKKGRGKPGHIRPIVLGLSLRALSLRDGMRKAKRKSESIPGDRRKNNNRKGKRDSKKGGGDVPSQPNCHQTSS